MHLLTCSDSLLIKKAGRYCELIRYWYDLMKSRQLFSHFYSSFSSKLKILPMNSSTSFIKCGLAGQLFRNISDRLTISMNILSRFSSPNSMAPSILQVKQVHSVSRGSLFPCGEQYYFEQSIVKYLKVLKYVVSYLF